MEPELLKVSDVAARLHVTSGRVYQLIRRAEIPAVRVGGAIRIPRAAFRAWLREQNSRARQARGAGKELAHGPAA